MACTPNHGKPFTKVTGFATPNGSMFEVNMAALLFLRGLNSGLDFHLATNVDGVGALDDVVFRVTHSDGTSNTFFVQLKHKDKPGTPDAPSGSIRKLLIDPKGKKSPVHSYFKSFCDIKNSVATLSANGKPFYLENVDFEDCIFVLYTNAVLEDVLSFDDSQHLRSYERAVKFLGSGSERILGFDPDGTSDLDKDVLKCLSTGEDLKNPQSFAPQVVRAFLGQFLVFSGQSSVGDFNDLLKVELSKVGDTKVKDVDANRLCVSFVHEMERWWEKSCYTLHKISTVLDTARTRIEIEDCSVLEKGRYCVNKLFYKESTHSMFNVSKLEKFSLVVVEANEDSLRLSYTKYHCGTPDSHLLLSIQGLLGNKDGVIREIESGRVRRLVLCAKDLKPDSDSFLCLIEVCAMLESYNGHVVMFSVDSETLYDKLKEKFTQSERLVDTFSFSQLTNESQDLILQKEFMHQNYKTTFIKLLGNDPSNASFIDAAIVLQMVEFNAGFLDAPELAENIRYYVDRTLEETNVVKESYLQLHPVSGNNFVENSSIQHVQSILQHGDESLERIIRDTLQKHFQTCVLSERQNSSSLVVGEYFTIGKFKCNFICVRGSIALQMRSTLEGIYSNLFLIQVKNEQDMAELSKFHNSLHFFSLQAGVLYWIKSRSPINVLAHHVESTVSTSLCSEMVNETTKGQSDGTYKLSTNRRLGIVCGEPGMGKSTLMTHLALETKAQFPDSWVIVIALNDNTDLFDDRELYKDALKYLLAAVFRSQFGLHEALFKVALQKIGNVVVILDGYDEIAPRYVSECRELIRSIRNTKARQILVTSRNSMKDALEDFLMTFAASLREFDEEDQRKFLKLYWKISREKARSAGTEILSEEELEAFITTLLEKTTQAISDQHKEFMSIPLQAQMVAEVFEDHVIGDSREKLDPSEKLDVLNLLHKFVEKKLHVFLQSRLRVKPTDTNYILHINPQKRDFKRNHSFAALVLILGKEDVKSLHPKDVAVKSEKFLKSIVDGKDKTGFIDRVVNGKPRFIHRVYAEYFVAKWFEKHFAENVAFLQQNLYTENFKVIREIFDLLLAKECHSKLHLAVLKSNAVQVQELLETGASVDETDGGGRTALHLSATLHSTIREGYEKIKKADADEILKLLVSRTEDFNLEDNVFIGSPLQYATMTRSWHAMDVILRYNPYQTCLSKNVWDIANKEMLKIVCEKDMDNLLHACLNQGLSVDHCFAHLPESKVPESLLFCSCKSGSLRVTNLLINSGANFKAVNAKGETSLHLASKSQNSNVIRLLLEAGRTSTAEVPVRFANEAERVQFVSAVDNDGNTALHIWAARLRGRTTEEILDLATESLEVVKLLVNAGVSLRQENNMQQTPLMSAATNYHSNVVEYMLENFVDERIESLERKPAETKEGEVENHVRGDFINKRDVSGLSALHHAIVKKRSDDIIPCLIKHGANVRSSDENGRTTLMSAISFHRGLDVVKDLVNAVDADKAEFLNTSDKKGNTAIHLSITEYQRDVFQLLVKVGGDFVQENAEGKSPLRLAVTCNFAELVEDILNAFDEMDNEVGTVQGSDGSKKAAYINMIDEDGVTVLADAASKGNKDIVSCLIKHGADVKVVNKDGLTPLQVVVNTGISYDGVITALLKALDKESRADYVNFRAPDGSTALHNAFSLDTIIILVEAGGDLSLPDIEGRTPFMVPVMSGSSEIVAYMLKHMVANGVTGYMEDRNEEGLTVLHLAAYNGFEGPMRLLLDDENADIWCLDGEFGGTPLHWAGKTNCDVLKVLLDACATEGEKYINFGDEAGDTALHWAVEDENMDSVRVLVGAGASVTVENKDGVTPLEAARNLDNKDIWYYLNSLGYEK